MSELSLESQYETLTLEAMAGESSLQQALTRLPEFFKAAKKKVADAFQHPIDALFPAKNLEWAAGQLIATPYPHMRNQQVPCVAGIKTDYLTYTERLADDAKFCRRLEAEYLDPFIAYLSAKLNNPDGLRSVRPDNSLDHITIKDLNVHNTAMSKLVDTHDEKMSKPYGKLIRRNADWPEVIAHSKVIHEAFTEGDHERFKGKIERANTLLASLIQRLTADQDAYKISAPVLKTVVDVAYVIANAVEYYGVTYRRALVLDYALDQLIESVKKTA
jgi:hypothetical protein